MAKLYFYYSAMNAGKTTALLQSSYNYQERGMRTMIYTAEIDNRFIRGKICSRIGISAHAEIFNCQTDLFFDISSTHHKQLIDCVLIDECHFLHRKQIIDVTRIVDELNIPVLCYGLRTDFRGKLFPGSLWLLAWADKLIELKTICHCGHQANRVLRVNDQGKVICDGKQVFIGGNNNYISVCRKHFMEQTKNV
ncbi:thymidine kinase [Blochmannia endosymbiont of Camponotus (Colobopsis) obliquus]|uniref:thymidine kinase n=1 Tax=Blochmannia endosymbiont of Camponotus (Colobopsis) obliquus TaxID=1505597 RepID=UPI00061A8B05|nr:thymidine kinase [Blochmannia endosymbiont of Camponotus (Colobopsis) obliquus]AKC60587.1 thymidine kinase [Blochmannia endosymbiont of Camponotus (Colobopsis) obliquus]